MTALDSSVASTVPPIAPLTPLPHPQVQRAVGWKRAPPQQPQPSADGQGEDAATAGLPRSSTVFPEPGGAGPKVRLPLSPGVQGDRVPPSGARLTILFLLRLPHMVLQHPLCELLPVSQRPPLFFRRRRCSRPPPPLAPLQDQRRSHPWLPWSTRLTSRGHG